MGFCTPAQHKQFLREVPEFERMLVGSNTIFMKFYLSITKDEQKQRFQDRRDDPLKQYKISPVDERAQEMWDKYTLAKYSMLISSNTPEAPWTIIRSDNKKKSRINCIKSILSRVDYPEKVDDKHFEIDKDIVFTGIEEISFLEEKLNN
jgi:polyphosphate kinase 2 (PPK2 family)